MGSKLKVILLAMLPFVILIVLPASEATAQTHPCWRNNQGNIVGYLYDDSSVCLPKPSGEGINSGTRRALYIRCRVKLRGGDEYTSNCCDHLTSRDADHLGVCEHRCNPPCKLDKQIQIDSVVEYGEILCRWAGLCS